RGARTPAGLDRWMDRVARAGKARWAAQEQASRQGRSPQQAPAPLAASRRAPATPTPWVSSTAAACVCTESCGEGEPAILFLPTWSITHARGWKAQTPDFARRTRVLTFDPRGNGKSDRPAADEAYAEEEFVGDALAVLDANGVDRAFIVSLSRGAQRAILLAAEHPERVLGAVFIDPFFPVSLLRSLHWRVMGHPR